MHLEVTKFNTAIGNKPQKEVNEAFWKMAEFQYGYLQSEVDEMKKAIDERDFTEFVDANCDIQYLRDFIDDLTLAVGTNNAVAFDIVCNNNRGKYTTDLHVAEATLKYLEASGKQVYINMIFHNSETLYTVRAKEDNKVQKLITHVPPDLSPALVNVRFAKGEV